MAPQLDFTYEIDEFNQYPITFQLPGNTYHSKKMFNTQEAMEFIREAEIVKKQLGGFLPVKNDQNNFVSIGENCSSAWYLKQVGLKRASYPFDWAFSSPDIILDCINSKSQFIIVDHYTNQFRKAQYRIIDESVITIQFSAGGASTGVYYCDPLDDFCYKLLMRGLS